MEKLAKLSVRALKGLFRLVLWRPFVFAAKLLCAFGVGASLLFFAYVHYWHADFKDKDVDAFLHFQPPLLTEIVDENGARLVELPGLARENPRNPYYCRWTEFKDFPSEAIDAIRAAEDKRFWTHSGIDHVAIGRAFSVLVTESFRTLWTGHPRIVFPEGASTLTQQAVRLVFLQNELGREQKGLASRQDKLLRKIKEMRMALWLESELGKRLGSKKAAKERVFEIYANVSYFGHGRYGMAAAHEFYFGKPIAEANAADAAMLAGLIRKPGKFSPRLNPALATMRRNQVLELMVANYDLTATSAVWYESEAITLAPVAEEKTIAPAVVSYVLDNLWGGAAKGITWENGVRVETFIRKRWQIAANHALENGLNAYRDRHPNYADKVQGALVVLGNDGKIRALVGGSKANYVSFNRVFAKRQPGSAFKPFVYTAALEKGWSLDCLQSNERCTVYDGPIAVAMGSGRPAHHIDNYDGRFLGVIQLWQALAESRNAATVRLANAVTADAVVETARRFNLSDSIEAYPTTAIGAEEVTPLELASAYSVFASGGVYATPQLVARVIDRDGKVYESERFESRRVLSQNVADEMAGALRHTVRWRHGTAKKLQELPFAVAGKTGTTNDFRDAWFCGFTYGPSGVTVCAWVGMDDNTPLGDGEKCKPLHPTDRNFCEPGGRISLPIVAEFFKSIYTKELPPQFPEFIEERVFAAEETGKSHTTSSRSVINITRTTKKTVEE